MSTAEKITKLRNQRSLTQAALAQDLNIGQSTLAMYEKGKRSPNLEMVTKFADYFHVTTDYLLDRENIDNKSDAASTDGEQKPLTENQKLIAYSIDPDISDEEREDIMQLVKIAMKNRRRI